MRKKFACIVAAAGLAGFFTVQSAAAASAVTETSPYSPGTLFVADQSCACVWEVPPGGSPGVFEGVDESPQDVATDAAGDLFWTQAGNGQVMELTSGGSLITVASGFDAPWGIGVDQSGNLFVGAFGGPSGQPAGLYKIPAGGSPSLVTSQFGVWSSVAVDGNGDVWGAGSSAELLMVPSGATSGAAISFPGEGYINGVRFDAGNDLYVSTGFGDVAAELPAGSTSSLTFGTGLNYTEGVAVDGSGDVFVGTPSGVPGFGKVYKIASGVQTLYATGDMADTGGLALWPPLASAARTASSTVLTTTSPSTINTERQVALTATVSPSTGAGPVQFDDNGSPLGGLVDTNGGVATTTTTLPQGTNQITATYLGNSSNAPSVSNGLTFAVTGIATTTTITAPDGTTIPGDEDATVDATVTGRGGTPTGDVEFFVNGKFAADSALSGREASASIELPPGTSNVTATYTGDRIFKASHSNKLAFTTTTPYNPSLNTTVSYGPPNSHNAVKASIKVTVAGVKGNGAPTGTVSADDGFTCGALTVIGTLRSSAVCSHRISSGTFESVDISYSGDSTYTSAGTSVEVDNGGGDD